MNGQQQYQQQPVPMQTTYQQPPGPYPQQQYVIQQGQIPVVPTVQTQSVYPQQPIQIQAQGQQVIYTTTAPKPETVWVDFDSKRARSLGITQIIVSLLCMIFNGIGIAMESRLERYTCEHCYSGRPVIMAIGCGFWCGAFYLVSGALAIPAAKKKTNTLLNATLGMSVISCIFGFTLFGSSAAGLGVVAGEYHKNKGPYGVYMTMAALLLILSIIEIVCSIWACHLCGRHICQCRKMKKQTVVQYTTSPAGGMIQPITTVPGQQATVFVPQQDIQMVPGFQAGAVPTMSPMAFPSQSIPVVADAGSPPPYTTVEPATTTTNKL